MIAPDNIREHDLSGQTLDRYQLVRRLGMGGMGAVYEAEHTRLRKHFAVKLLRYELAHDELYRKRFLREARSASAVNHPHVVAISDFGETEDGHVFFVMELLEGKDLHDLLEAERVLPWPRTREILLQVTSALHAAHQKDIIHRDIKPSNVFLADVPSRGDEDFVKVLDFGIAKLSGTTGKATAKLTSTDELFGTVAYMAPEMANGKNDDPRSDVYAVGVMMFRMLTGQLPYTEGNAYQILSQHINAPIPSPREENPAIPEAVEAIVLRAMAKRPDERFATMEDFNRALHRGMLEATEVLVGVQVALQAQAMREPTADRSRPEIDKTTPLPAKKVGTEVLPRTEVASPRPQTGPFVPSESEGGHHLSAPGDSDSLTWEAPTTGSSGAMAPVFSDSPAVPLYEKTVASTPILVEPSGSMSAPEVAEHGAVDEHDEPQRSVPGWVLPMVGVVAVLGGVIGLSIMSAGGKGAGAEQPARTAASARSVDAKTKPSVSPLTTPDLGVSKTELPVEPELKSVEPEPAEPMADDGARPAKPEPMIEPEPTRAIETAKSKRTKTRKPRPTKPKTDHEVVAALKAKISAKCEEQLSGKVKVEGMINPAGRVEGLLVTPQNGLGGCLKLVEAARFDPQGGVRPMPRFSVEP
ncbi:MAG: protein kinase [Nannocystaceae bacterium]